MTKLSPSLLGVFNLGWKSLQPSIHEAHMHVENFYWAEYLGSAVWNEGLNQGHGGLPREVVKG